mmetsp:Transcript_14223/g.29943  ORF Transcript_14223/g.29943 Transcript_14223/m.29943 type:complete len:85 (+) Transcript_14223:130-384(+)
MSTSNSNQTKASPLCSILKRFAALLSWKKDNLASVDVVSDERKENYKLEEKHGKTLNKTKKEIEYEEMMKFCLRQPIMTQMCRK